MGNPSLRQNGTNRGRKIVFLLYAIVLAMLVLLLVMYRLGAPRDYRSRSRAFDSAVASLLAKKGIPDSQAPQVSERKEGGKRWQEYHRSILVPGKTDPVALIIALRETAKANGVTLTVSAPDPDVFTARGELDGVLVSLIEARAGSAAAARKKRVAIVIDDAGYTRDISAFLGIGIPITIAILPHEIHSKDIARELAEKGMPYILHLPLEPEKYPSVDPGKAALLLSMNDVEIERMFLSDVHAVPGVCGVSNHMGSAFSEDETKMRTLLGLVKEQGLFYFDSYTTPRTRAAAAAKIVGLPFAECTLFLDLQDDPAFMKEQFAVLLRRVTRTGTGIAIGHVQKKHMVTAIAEAVPEFKKAGVEFVYLRDLVKVPPSGTEATLAQKTK